MGRCYIHAMQCERAVQGYTWGLQAHREGTCSRRGARRPHEDMLGQLVTQVAGAEGLYGARVGGGEHVGMGREKGRAQAHLWCCGLSPTEAFMPGRDETTLIAVDGSGCLCLGG